MALRSVTAAPWLVYGTLRPSFCWLRVLDDQAPRAISSYGCPWVLRDCVQRETNQARYAHSRPSVNRVYDSKARRYAEDNRTELNCIRTGKSETEVTNTKKTALEVLYYWSWLMTDTKHRAASLRQQSYLSFFIRDLYLYAKNMGHQMRPYDCTEWHKNEFMPLFTCRQ